MKDSNKKKRFASAHKAGRAAPPQATDGMRMVIGRNTIEAVLLRDPSRVVELLVSAEERGRAEQLLTTAQRAGVKVSFIQKAELSKRAGSDSHQGFIALIQGELLGTRQALLEHTREADRYLIVALDGVLDPHNVGAIIRAAECFGIDGVVWSKNRSPGITPAVTKVAVGATELVPLYQVANLADTLLALEKESGASIMCADGGEGAVALGRAVTQERLVLVLGAEGDGVSDLIKRRAQIRVQIPMLGQIDSLNVSQAAAVFFYELKRLRE
jgi:23S rRNA (guanosine2251-2'-O)-methyltransferase